MSQRKVNEERVLELAENALASGARIRKLTNILRAKVCAAIQNPTVQRTSLEDLDEIEKRVQAAQFEITELIKHLGL